MLLPASSAGDQMPRFKVTIEYQGTRYSGWQVQKNARTVQGEILAELGKASAEHGLPDL